MDSYGEIAEEIDPITSPICVNLIRQNVAPGYLTQLLVHDLMFKE